MHATLLAFSLSSWFFEAWGELVRYFNMMNTLQWGIVSSCSVIFGFLCLRGSNLYR